MVRARRPSPAESLIRFNSGLAPGLLYKASDEAKASYRLTFMVPATRLGFLPLLLLLAGAGLGAAQTPVSSPPVQSPAASADPQLPVDLARIKTGVMTPQSLTLVDAGTMRIYVNTVAPFPKFRDIVGDFDLRKGGVPHSGMTHQEFVQSTRPKDMYSSAGFTVSDVLRFAILQYTETKAFELMRKGALALREAKTQAERKAIQARIEKELAALRGDIK